MKKHSVQQARTLSTHITPERDVTLNYLLYLPPGYDPQRSERWPLVLFLHGSSMRGDDINLVKRQGLSKLVNPTVVVTLKKLFELRAYLPL